MAAERSHGHAHEVQVITCTLETLGSSIAGRMLTGAAASAEAFRLALIKGDDETVRTIRAHLELIEAMEKINARIAQLDQESQELEARYSEAALRSESAFADMEALEDVLYDIAESGMTNARRASLKKLIGPEADDITDDALLLILAREQLEQKRQEGIDAQEEADSLREKITQRQEEKSELEQARDEIMNDATLSSEEKTARTKDALERSFTGDLYGAERASATTEPTINLKSDIERSAQRSELAEADTFEMDETMDLDAPEAPATLSPR